MANVFSMDLRVRFKTLMDQGVEAAAAGKMRLVSPATAARWGKKGRDGASLEPHPSGPRKGSGRLKPLMPVFLELIEQDPDITLAELQAALLAAHDVTASTRGIDALLRRHGCSYINQHFVSAGYGIEELGVPHRYREGTAIAFFLSLTIADLNRLRTNITGPGGSLLIYNVEKEIRAA